MTRFNISLQESVDFVLKCLKNSKGGEVFIPKMASYNILNLAKALAPNAKKKIIGIRAGEKIHEELIGINDSTNTFDLGSYYVVVNPTYNKVFQYYKSLKNSTQMKPNFTYNSLNNKNQLNLKQIKNILKIFNNS